MIDINPSPYQKKSLKTQNRASRPVRVATTGFCGFEELSKANRNINRQN